MNNIQKRSVIISFDIEADGPAPLVNSCLMIGMCVLDCSIDPIIKHNFDRFILSRKEWCLKEQEGCVPDKECMEEFWSKNMTIYNYIKQNEKDVRIVMQEFNDWIIEMNTKYNIVNWVAKPSSYDWQWINCLFHKYKPVNPVKLPFSIRCLSSIIKTCEMANIKLSNLKHDTLSHTHNALDDCIEQGYMYVRILHQLKH